MLPTDRPREITIGDHPGEAIPILYWPGQPARGAVIIAHGVYSHAGWFRESGSIFHQHGFTVVAYDRRGAGKSGHPSGHVEHYRDFVHELDRVAQWLDRQNPGVHLHLAGQSFGSLVVIAFAARRPDAVRSITLITPGFASRKKLKPWQLVLVPVLNCVRPRHHFSLPFGPADFVDDPEIVGVIMQDELCQRTASVRFFWQTLFLMKKTRRAAGGITKPLFMALAGRDEICDNKIAQQFFGRLASQDKLQKIYAFSRHSLLLGPCRNDFIEDWTQWVMKHENRVV